MARKLSGENICHFAAIRIRLTGKGSLRMSIHSLDDMRVKHMVPFAMNTSSRIIPTRLVNFVEQRASFQLSTINIDETFRINRIIIYSKEIYTSSPEQAVPSLVVVNPLNTVSLD